MDTIIKECETLDLSWLESTIGDFHLVVEQKALSSTVYSIFYYTNDRNWRWSALYDTEVGGLYGTYYNTFSRVCRHCFYT